MLTRHLWLGLLGFVAGAAALAYAQTPDTSFSLWNFNSAPPAAESQTTPPKTEPSKQTSVQNQATNNSTTEKPDFRLYGPDIWRLPMVNGPPAAAPPPAALILPPTETMPTPTPSPFPAAANAPASLSGVLSGDEPLQIKPDRPEVVKLWDGSFDLGLDGAEGNSQTFNIRFGCHGSRKAESNVLTFGLDYNKSTAQGNPTANRLFFESRFEWLIHDTRWSWFVHETVLYDEFQSFNVRDTSDAGLGYRLVKNENTVLVGRVGSGFSHEYGGPEDGRYIPEMVFGVQLEHQVSSRQKILGLVEYAPNVGDFLHYRIRAQAAWELLLDAERNLSLRMGVLDMYNSPPNGVLPNNLDYALVLIWKF